MNLAEIIAGKLLELRPVQEGAELPRRLQQPALSGIADLAVATQLNQLNARNSVPIHFHPEEYCAEMGVELLPEDRKFLVDALWNGGTASRKDQLLKQYVATWIGAMSEGGGASHGQNAGRLAANTWLRSQKDDR